jgi:hypothetical protein
LLSKHEAGSTDYPMGAGASDAVDGLTNLNDFATHLRVDHVAETGREAVRQRRRGQLWLVIGIFKSNHE